ncbi:MAG: tetratricopeptide repeat protein [Bacteroidetes bacterium]|nr:tetratricopeptide repeat protein [Rhodothermia bacterium]MCS7156076.1 tetratricopeptide repeat protein [Bacteroidota bacterium]MCX7907764.1 tetratricopeptide repeat protein [Bacteroidota bacterium]MDW8137893.1 tetratricopeptide repeat protein [Bacteroidota bacterium]MDW8286256.1 tetratricopeptide repeat protein [Bacteroidota bacterium]
MSYAEQLQRAIALLEEGAYPEALPVFASCLEQAQEDPAPLWGYGLCLEQLGRYEEAVAVYERLLDSEGLEARFRAVLLNNLGLCQARLGRWEQARRCFEAALPDDPTAQSGRNLAMALVELGAYQEGIEQLVRTLRAHPHDVPTALVMAGYLEEVGAWKRAASYYAWVRDLLRQKDPEHPDLSWVTERAEKLGVREESVFPNGGAA